MSDDRVKCVIDRTVLNKNTFKKFEQTDGALGLWVFAPLCGRNRGAFVLDPPDGGTYGCAEFPPHFARLAGVSYDNITDSNSIKEQYDAKKITSADALNLLDFYVKSVYHSSPRVDTDSMACAVNGLTKLECNTTKTSHQKIRAVTLAGVLVPAPWATGGQALTVKQAEAFYTADDFTDMKKLGLNAVQIPVPLSVFSKAEYASTKLNLLGSLIGLAGKAGLGAVVLLADDVDKTENVKAVQAAAAFVMKYDNLISLVVPSKELVSAAREESTTLLLMIPTTDNELPFVSIADPNILVALDRGHITSIADIASSESKEDRNKLYYHEMMACLSRTPIEYSACYRGVPAYVVNGFNLANDNCIYKDSVDFVDYGQCGRFNETVFSGWWHAHRESFAARQLAAFETGAGWTFDAWKLYDEDHENVGVIDSPAKLMTLKNVAAAGLLPDLTESAPGKYACLLPPENDVILGDDTLSPTAGPPPDCGNGWWVEDHCEFFVPPTPCPNVTDCGEGAWWSPESQDCQVCAEPQTTGAMVRAGTIGAAIAIVCGAILLKIYSWKRRAGYTQVSELTV